LAANSGRTRRGNPVAITTAEGQCVPLRGKGAGRWPTPLAVPGDVYEMLRERDAAASGVSERSAFSR